MFTISIEHRQGWLTCRPEGDLDASTASQLRASFDTLVHPMPVLIDLSGVPFVDSAGLGALVGGVRRIREAGGTVTVCAGRRSIARVLRTVGFDRVVHLVDSLEEVPTPPASEGDDAVLAVGAGAG
jgi:anti-sigma B factor antagonist